MEEIFEKYPKLEVYYKTSDENAFFSESDAKNHAKGLEDKRVIPVYRPVKEIIIDDFEEENLTGKEEIPTDEPVNEFVPEKEENLLEESETKTKRTKTKK
jgi:hypothetical protein